MSGFSTEPVTAAARRGGAELFVDILEAYDVTHVFANPGTTERPIVDAVADSGLEYVLTLHEDVAVGAAAGFASTRRYHAHRDPDVLPLGVVNVHVAPGMAHGLSNLHGAAFAGAPLLVTAGSHPSSHRTREPVLEGDMLGMVEPYTKWAVRVEDAADLPRIVRRAVQTALTPPTGPVFIDLPVDVQNQRTSATPERLGHVPTAGPGDPEAIDRAAEVLAAAQEPVFVVGDGLARAGPKAVEGTVRLAEALGARVHGELFLSEAAFPTGHEQWVSFLPLDSARSAELIDVDTLLFAGCSTNVPPFDPPDEFVPDTATTVHVGVDARHLGKNEPGDATVLGDPCDVMVTLAERLDGTVPASILEARRDRILAVERAETRRRREAVPTDPSGETPSKLDLAEALVAVIEDERLVDEGVTAGFLLRDELPLDDERFLATKGGGLGYGLPAAIGSAIAESLTDAPRPVIGFVGDGALQYYPQALYTAVRSVDAPLTIVVVDNDGYGILREADVRRGVASPAPLSFGGGIDPVTIARGYGLPATQVGPKTHADLTAGLRSALDADGPSLVNVEVFE